MKYIESEMVEAGTTRKIISEIESNPHVSIRELAKAVGLTGDGVKYHLTQLKKKGSIKRIGPDRGGYWKVLSVLRKQKNT